MAGKRRAPSSNTGPVLWVGIAAVLLGLVLITIWLLPDTDPAPTDLASGPSAGSTGPTAPPTPSPTPTLPPLPLHDADVRIETADWYAWAVMDTRTGEIFGSANQTETSTTASMIKAWIGADYLRRTAEAGRQPDRTHLHMLTIMIRDSDNTSAESLYREIGGVASIKRLIRICELTDSRPAPNGGWSRTELSPRDTARMGACIADGRAAGPEWTEWLLDEMRAVRGIGNFGIRKAFPASVQKTIAIKNGWVDRTAEQEYHVSCLAIGDGWTMSVMSRHSINAGYLPGAKVCEDVARQLRID